MATATKEVFFTTERSTVIVLFDSLLSSALCPDNLSQSTMFVLPEAQGFKIIFVVYPTNREMRPVGTEGKIK